MPLAEAPDQASETTLISIEDFCFFYGGGMQALHHIDLEIPSQRVTAFIGPSGCGKSTLLRSINPVSYTHLTLPTIYSV